MRDPLQTLGGTRLGEILSDLASHFQVSVTLQDTAGIPVCRQENGNGNVLGDVRSRTLPIRFMHDPIGFLVVEGGSPAVATAAAYFLESMIKSEAEIADLSGEVVRVYEEFSQMYSLTNKLGSEMDVDTICRRVLEETQKILDVENLSVMLLSPDDGILRTVHSLGRDALLAAGFTADTESGLIGQVLRQGTPLTVCDITVDNTLSLPYPATSILCVPLITDDRAMGLLMAADKRSGEEFWSRELKLMGMFAMEIAASIMKAQLYQDINSMFINTVEAFASAIDAKDPYTYGHSRRVARISMAICGELGIPKRQTRMVELAALLHDIGKIGTPEYILHKPGILQPEEFEKIKEHPGKGAEILSGIKEFSEIITWIRHHHEWYDGEGYPDRIAAENIPMEARIITIADAYDAMTSDRPYRKGMPHTEVVKIMEEFTRSQFDPEILAAFKRIIETASPQPVDKMAAPPPAAPAAPGFFAA